MFRHFHFKICILLLFYLTSKKFTYIIWASHFVRNGNKLSISSRLTTEVQVCQNVDLPNTRPPKLVYRFSWTIQIHFRKQHFEKLRFLREFEICQKLYSNSIFCFLVKLSVSPILKRFRNKRVACLRVAYIICINFAYIICFETLRVAS